MSLPETLLKHIEMRLDSEYGIKTRLRAHMTIGGGDINQAWRISTDDNDYFLKLNSARLIAMFGTEAYSLQVISKSGCIACPKVLLYGAHKDHAFLLMEYLELSSSGNEAELGRQLAQMHRKNGANFGWPINNFIGKTPQSNKSSNSWCEFWLQNRLVPQLMKTTENGFLKKLITVADDVMAATEAILATHTPPASLLHGDLWSGNKAWLANGEPVIFDPASYYGDRETDLAMTELFGGFGADFYSGYNEVWSIEAGYQQRKDVYNLYHMLNHLNLFGSGYLPSCLALAKKIITVHASS